MFRLRKLGDGQSVVFVVATQRAPLELKGDGLLTFLEANEQTYSQSAARIKSTQARHASIPKRTPHDFSRDVKIDQGFEIQQRQQQQQQQQQQQSEQLNERAVTTTTCVTSETDATTCGRFRTLDNEDNTKAQKALLALRIGLSPMITCARLLNECGEQTLRRVFALRVPEHPSTAGADLVVMSIVEAWSTDDDRSRFSVYTQDGALMPVRTWAQRPGADPGMILLGRFLCDGALSLSEELELLAYVARRYATDIGTLKSAVSCLIGSRFLTTPMTLLHRLATHEPSAILADARKREPGQFTRISSMVMQLALKTHGDMPFV
jgi:hypothetical protein